MTMTTTELDALPAVVDLVTAGRAIGCSRSKAYHLHAAGEFPVPVRKVGSRYKVSKADLLRYLGADAPARPEKEIRPDGTYRVSGRRLLALIEAAS